MADLRAHKWTFEERLEARFQRAINAWLEGRSDEMRDGCAGDAKRIAFSTIRRGQEVSFIAHITPLQLKALSTELLFAYRTTLKEENCATLKVVS